MIKATLFCFIVSVLVPALADQFPVAAGQRWEVNRLDDDDPAEWYLDKTPNPNATNHLMFETVASLLQHWPNTRMRNGHNIVPGTIPKGTLFYHGTNHEGLPLGPEWVALDPEHSYCFCGGQQGCWQLTLATTRTLKVLYFDGKSAAKLPFGPLDTQDLLAWGELRPRDTWDEMRRIKDLCAWGTKFGIDGFVRMEVAFEVMLCDFTSGVSVVSSLNIVRTKENMATRVVFEALYAGSWHNRFPGETRIQLDLAGLVSFYDTQLVPSLVPVRVGQERRQHRAGYASDDDLSVVISRLEAALIRPARLSSGIDWRTLIQVVIDRYAERLELTQYLVNTPATSPDEIFDSVRKTQTQLRIMLTPYLLLSAVPTDPSNEAMLDWTAPIYRLCATVHTEFTKPELDSMTDSEKSLLRAVQATSREICRVVTKMWAAGVYAGIDPLLNTKESLDIDEVTRVRITWGEELYQFMKWLDWSVWVKCNPSCGPKEICFVHKWPANFDVDPGLRSITAETLVDGIWNADDETDPEKWVPQPKCISRVDP